MKTRHLALLAILSFGLIQHSCKKDPTVNPGNGNNDTNQTVTMTPYELPHPVYYPQAIIPDDNKMYEERIQLGKKLFLDPRLSNDGSTCESCHQQKYGFSMDGVSAPDNGLTALPLVNLAWYKNFMWNGRIVGTLEDVMMSEVTVRFKTDINKMNNIEEYRTLFKKYYNVDVITAKDLSYALAQYMRFLVSKDTRDETAFKGQILLNFDEQKGKEIFFSEVKNGGADCFHCHVAVITTDNMLHNNGLDTLYAKEIDKGYYNVTKNPADLGKFRTPSLRNLAQRTSFMHDGRFKTLEEVVDFYDHGIHMVSNIDPLMTKPDKLNGLQLSPIKKKQLIAYLKTFTDTVMLNDPKYHAP